MMAVGKSALGRIVAKKLNLEFVDTDLNIEKKHSMKIRKIFENKGEKFFRLEEEKEVLECLKKNKTVIALGGGAFMNKNIRDSILNIPNRICSVLATERNPRVITEILLEELTKTLDGLHVEASKLDEREGFLQ